VEKRPGSEEEVSDERLLAEFLSGGASAFSFLVARHANDLHQFVGRFLQNSAAAEDIVQETFIQVHQSAAGFDPGRRFRPWLFTIAANKARDYLRSRMRKREVPLAMNGGLSGSDETISYLDFTADEVDSPAEIIEAQEERAIVREVVSRMPSHLREVLVLGYYQRFPYREIAEIIGIPLGTVKSRLHAAVSHFAAAYRRETEVDEADDRMK